MHRLLFLRFVLLIQNEVFHLLISRRLFVGYHNCVFSEGYILRHRAFILCCDLLLHLIKEDIDPFKCLKFELKLKTTFARHQDNSFVTLRNSSTPHPWPLIRQWHWLLLLVNTNIVLRRLDLLGNIYWGVCTAFSFGAWCCHFALNASLQGLAYLLG